MIHEYFSECLSDFKSTYHLIYFDFDNFKPFNDKYGFRNGDRLILMFADMLKKKAISKNRFIGHVGGDDFFLGIKNADRGQVLKETAKLAETFKKNAESFYDSNTIECGYMAAKDRYGKQRQIPLISISTAILELPENVNRACSIEDAANLIALLKKEAKRSENKMASASIMEFLCVQMKETDLSGNRFVFEVHPDQCRDLNLSSNVLPDP